MKNIFLTGIPGAGKSTIIDQMLHELQPSGVTGFFTTRESLPDSRTFWLNDRVTFESCVLAQMDFKLGKHSVNLEAFEPFAIDAMSRPGELLILDELGRFEEPCEDFKSAVHAALSGSTPVLGVLKVTDTPFVQSISARTDVRIITVTEDTRDQAYRDFRAAVESLL